MDNEFVFLKHFSTIICNYVDSSLIPRLPRLQLSLHAVLSYSKLGCGSRERGQKDASLLSWRRGSLGTRPERCLIVKLEAWHVGTRSERCFIVKLEAWHVGTRPERCFIVKLEVWHVGTRSERCYGISLSKDGFTVFVHEWEVAKTVPNRGTQVAFICPARGSYYRRSNYAIICHSLATYFGSGEETVGEVYQYNCGLF